jgi:hypothetical protein
MAEGIGVETLGRLQPLGGCTCDAGDGFSGLTWGPTFRSKFADGRSAPLLCAQIGPLMPGPGESKSEVSDIFLHCHVRIVELVAGTEGESLFLPGEPWFAADDRAQEISLASLICSAEATEPFINYCRAEARALLTAWAHVVHALAHQLKRERTMDGTAIDMCIARAVAAKSAEDERQRRLDWQRRCESAARYRS